MNITSLKLSDQSNSLINNFITLVNGVNTSGDYFSILTSNYQESPYIINATFLIILPDPTVLQISSTIYLNPYIAKFIVPPNNYFKFV